MATATGPAIARMIGSGHERPNAELPIDINYQRLVEWMVTRQKLPNDWHKRVQAIQAKITEATKELPPELLASLPGGPEAGIDYFKAVLIRDKLAETGERTLFGGLSGKAGVWDQVVKAYEKGGVYLGEAAQHLVQYVDYEIPYLRKQQSKNAQMISDAERKQADYIKGAAACAANFQQECGKLGISGSNVRQELRELGGQLPPMFVQLLDKLQAQGVAGALDYYSHFTRYAHSAAGEGAGTASASEQLSTLAEVREGRTAPPPPEEQAAGSGAAAAAVDIDWDLSAAASGEGAGGGGGDIDWDLDLGAAASSGEGANNAAGGSGIDWDLGDLTAAADDDAGAAAAAPEAAASAAAGAAGPVDISWDIELTEAAAAAPAQLAAEADWGTDAGSAAGNGGDEAGERAEEEVGSAVTQRLERDAEYRAQLMDDLQELRAFLLQRKQEMGGGGGGSDLLNALMPDALQAVDSSEVAGMLAGVEGVMSDLNAPKMRQLLMLRSSPRYLERMTRELQRKAGQEAKMQAAAHETAARRQEAVAALASLAPKLAEHVAATRQLKGAVESGLSALLNGRRVNVLGEVNNVLSAGSS